MMKPVYVEHSIEIDAPADRVFERYSDVEKWSEWDPDTASSRLEGGFVVGARGRIVPSKGFGVPMELVQLTEGRSFTVVSKIPLFRMRFDHEIEPRDGSVLVTHRVILSGPLLLLLGKRLGAQINEGLPLTLASLKALVEKDTASSTLNAASSI